MELNIDVPITYCHLRAEYLYNLQRGHMQYIPCAIFAASSVQGRAIGFHCMLNNGAVIYRLPISAFVHNLDVQPPVEIPLHHLQLWDCFSPHMTCNEHSYLRGLRVEVLLKDKKWYEGIYQYTLDWYGNSLADNPGEGGHKCAHIIALNNGTYCAQPNNRIKWHEPSFVTVPFPERPDYETNDIVWSVENKGEKWATENNERMFYDLKIAESDLCRSTYTDCTENIPRRCVKRRGHAPMHTDGKWSW